MENINNAKQNVIIGVVMKLKNAGFVSANAAESTVHNGNKLLNNAENFENESMAVAAETRSPPFPIVALRFCMKPLLFVFVEFVANIKVFEDDDDSSEEEEVFSPPTFSPPPLLFIIIIVAFVVFVASPLLFTLL
jgi:hypothetical protein|tara:strand:+ start:556 stop:960 length:405 start_codon:yes stop_codon:yes gene_type:complete